MHNNEKQKFDLVIVGGGVSGSALLYTLAKYSNVKNICLVEKHKHLGCVNSSAKMNSQTLHFGDIETNYPYEKAKAVKRQADMVKFFLEFDKKDNPNNKLFSRYSKMVLAVGSQQVNELRSRFNSLSPLFPNLRQIEREEIARIEPRVVEGRESSEEILALVTDEGYTVDFGKLSRTFVDYALKINPSIKVYLDTHVEGIKSEGSSYNLISNAGTIDSKTVVFAAGGHSIKFAKSLGYGQKYSILSIAGSFYLGPKMLNGKVYTMQEEKLPFAAIHGDPEVHNQDVTRFGPTAKAIFLLERYNYFSFIDYLKVFGIGIDALLSIMKILRDKVVFIYLLKNFLYELPFIGKRLFLKEIQKIVPTAKLEEIHFAKGYGGTRPQTINNETRSLEMGEAKIIGQNIIFNITPSPGASTCLGNAFADSLTLMKFFGGRFSFASDDFERDLSGA